MNPYTVAAEPNPTVHDICLQAVEHVEELIAQITRGSNPLDESNFAFDQAQVLLEALPLNTDEFSRAVNRLKNANRYLRSCEFGAACYELRLLAGSLCHDRHYRANGSRHLESARQQS
jgi:hypothetical protein